MGRARLGYVVALAASASACFIDLDLSGRPCPCAEPDWTCDETAGVCVPTVVGEFSLATDPDPIRLRMGRSDTISLTLNTSVTQAVTARFVDLPPGVLASPSEVRLSRDRPRADVTLTATSSAAIGAATVALEGIGPRGDRTTRSVTIDVGGRPGTLDPDFGTAGLGLIPVNFPLEPSVVLRPDDRIVVAGTARGTDGRLECFVAQLSADGVIDEDFGAAGVTTISNSSATTQCRARDVALQADGKILVAGALTESSSFPLVMRFHANGVLDPTFGTAGMVIQPWTGHASAVAVQADGRIVVAGTSTETSGQEYIAVFALRDDGSLDSSFGDDGRKLTALTGNDDATDMVVLPDDRIIVAATQLAEPPRAVLVRLDASGAEDLAFARTGVAAEQPETAASLVRLAADGALLHGGALQAYFNVPDYPPHGVFVARHFESGEPDPEFGDAGAVALQDTAPLPRGIVAMAVSAQGIVAADRELYFVLDAAGRFDDQIGFVPAPVDISDIQVQGSGRSVVVGVRAASLLVVRFWP